MTAKTWGGIIASLGCLLVVWLIVVLLCAWDDPDKARRDQNREAMRDLAATARSGGLFNDHHARPRNQRPGN